MVRRPWRLVIGLICVGSAGFVIVSELPFWLRQASLAPVLTALAVAVICAAVLTRFWDDSTP